jgi:Fur family ferric uptake transcriptional regulator
MRLLVAEKLLKQQYAVSHKELAEQFEKADNVTFFRTLKIFLEHKLIHTIDDGSG